MAEKRKYVRKAKAIPEPLPTVQASNGMKFQILNFNAAFEPPTYKYDSGKGILTWGDKNNYPNHISNTIYNYKGSVIHKAILDKKVRQCTGNGFKKIQNPALEEFVKQMKLVKQLKRVSLDYELINGQAYEVIWDKKGKNLASIKHINFHKLRIGIEDEEFPFPHYKFSNNWEKWDKSKDEKFTPQIIAKFDPNNRKGKQIYWFIEYNPEGEELYPIPNYSQAIQMIELEYAIDVYDVNQAKQNYFPSFILNMASGFPSQDEMDEFARDFDLNFKGVENAGKILITYSNGKDGRPTLETIKYNNSTELFKYLQEKISEKIIAAHGIPPQLIKPIAGSLGGSEQKKDLQAQFQDDYITPRQAQLEECLNELIKYAGFDEELILQTYLGEQAEEEVVVDDKQAEAQAQLKGSVGGVQALLQVQTSVAQGLTDRTSAKAILKLIYGFSPEEAEELLGDVKEGQGTTDTNNPNKAA